MLERREFLMRTGASMGIALSAPVLAWLGASQASAAGTPEAAVRASAAGAFSDTHRRAAAAAADTILPRTATPGALDAGVPEFIEMMVAEWYSEEERTVFLAGLEQLDARAAARGAADFASLDGEARATLLGEFAREAGAAASPGSVSRGDSWGPRAFFPGLKELVVVGFFTSEVGAPLVGGGEIIPGQHVGCELPPAGGGDAGA